MYIARLCFSGSLALCVCGKEEMEREEAEEKSSLRSPLIQISEEDGVCSEGSNGNGVLDEVRKQLWLAGPLIAVSLLQYCLQVISIMFVGHLGELALSGASMATSFASVTGFSLLVSWVLFSFYLDFSLIILGWKMYCFSCFLCSS
jgi:hypothetical protein